MFSFISTVEPRALFNWMQAGERACLIDVRDREEFATAHTVGALSIPAHTVDADSIARLLDREAGCDSPIYLLSESGVRAEQVAYRLHRQGLLNAMPVEGGFARWRAEGLPHRRVERIPSIERQVWIAVGAVLLIVLAKAAASGWRSGSVACRGTERARRHSVIESAGVAGAGRKVGGMRSAAGRFCLH